MIFILCVCVMCCLYLYFEWRRFTPSTSEPPIFTGALPIIGHAHLAYGDTIHFLKFLQRISMEATKVGGAGKLLLGPYSFYVVSDPVDCLAAMNACVEKSELYNFGKRWLGDGLLIANGQTWKNHRKLLNPMFTQQTLNSFIGVFNEQARRLVNNLEDKLGNGPFEYEHYLLVWSLESVCKTIMGVDIGDDKNENNDYVNAINNISKVYIQRIPKVWFHNEYIYSWSSLRKEEDKLLRILKTRSEQVLLKRKSILTKMVQHDEDMSDHFRPLIDHILLLSTEQEAFSDVEILDEVNTFIVSGYETTGHALIYTLMTLGVHQYVQDRVYKEIESIFESEDKDVEKHDLPKMVYTEAVIKETLRLYPIIPMYGKLSTTDIKLSNYTIPAGCHIFASASGACRDPMWGVDADQFRPERWLDPASLPINGNALPFFGLGKRSCIGRNYALMSMKTTLAHILRKYKITSHSDNPTFKMEIVLKSVTPLLISLESRK